MKCDCGTITVANNGFETCPSCGLIHEQIFYIELNKEDAAIRYRLSMHSIPINKAKIDHLTFIDLIKSLPLKTRMVKHVESFSHIFDIIPETTRFDAIQLWKKVYNETEKHGSTYVIFLACVKVLMSRRNLPFNLAEACAITTEHGYCIKPGYIARCIRKSLILSKIHVPTSASDDIEAISSRIIDVVGQRYPDTVESSTRAISRKMLETVKHRGIKPRNAAILSVVSAIQILDSAYGLKPISVTNLATRLGMNPGVMRNAYFHYFKEKTLKVSSAVNNNPEKMKTLFKIEQGEKT